MSDLERSEYARLLDQLTHLERELLTVRRELGQQRRSSGLPRGVFEALRVALGGEQYALASQAIRQIIRFARLSRIPNADDAVLGALNLRGEVVVVVDVALRLGLGRVALDQKTPVVIALAHGHLLGLVVDRVLDVVTLDAQQLEEPSPSIASAVCVAAVGQVQGQLLQLLDLDRLLSPRELESLEHAADGGDSGEEDDGWPT